MFSREARVLLILPEEILDRARALAGRATASMKLAVSLQIVFRALIEEGLKRQGDEAVLANVARQAQTVRRIRSEARRRSATAAADGGAGRGRRRPGVRQSR